MNKIRIGVIGCGGIAKGKHIPAYKAMETKAEIVALCDILPERMDEVAKQFGLEKAVKYADYRELLKNGDIDAVCVCTPNISHCEITVAALKAGKHVMCEKPMAMNYNEAMLMVKAAKESGKVLTIGYQNRYRFDSRYLKKECEKGELGDIYYAKARAVRRRAVPTWGVFLDEEKQGGGPLIDIGTHALDLTLYMMNNYKPKYAVGTTYHKLNDQTETANAWGDWDTKTFTVEDSAFGFVVMENGATVFLESSWALNVADVGEAQTTLCGTKAGADMMDGLRINGVKNNAMYITRPQSPGGGVAFNVSSPDAAPHIIEADTFLNAVAGTGKLVVEPEQAAVITRILEGIYASAKSGKPYFFE